MSASVSAPRRPGASPQPSTTLRLWNLEVPRDRVGVEVLAGLTTFLVMAYIIFVNPSILGFAGVKGLEGKGLPFTAVLTSTCLVAGIMTILMGLYTNKAFAIAPGMGLNAVVAFQLVATLGLSWPAAMGVILVEGLIITALVITGFRQAVFDAVPLELKRAIGVGIGWFILFIGLFEAGFIKPGPAGVPVTLGDLVGVPVFVATFGLALTAFLFVRHVRAALLIGILVSTIVATALNYTTGLKAFSMPGVATLPASIVGAPDFSLIGQVDPIGLFVKLGVISAVLIILSIMLSDFFDTVGTLLGVGEQASYVDDRGKFDKVDQPLLVDSLAAVAGGLASSSSATTYIESAAGVGAGGRTGLVSVVVGVLFLVALPFSPIIGMVPKEATAPALILVGYLMMSTLGKGIDFSDVEVGLPAVLTMAAMPLTYSITNGIGVGFITYVFLRLARGRSVNPLMAVVTAAFVIYFLEAYLHAQFGI
jgi:AGZA family xanthine/uracil permease-like MFS transporter